MEKVQTYWNECLEILKDDLTGSAFRTWFAPIRAIEYDNNTLVLLVRSRYIVEYIEDNYIDTLKKAIFQVFGKGTRLEYRIMVDSQTGAASTIPSEGVLNEHVGAVVTNPYKARPVSDIDSQLNPSYNFANFVEGECNKLPRTAGLAIAREPGRTVFNPLFIYGGSGVGKTHLANAIGNQVKSLYPEKRVLYVPANTFQVQYTDAVVNQKVNDFINFYQTIDVLIIDDIQYWAEKKGTQNTFFFIFNHLHQSGKQLILTSDKPPVELCGLEERLITRFKWGLSAEIKRPDFQLRKNILKNRIYRDGIEMSEEVVNFIAESVRENIRDLEGVLASLLAYSTLTDRQIDLPLAQEVVGRVVLVSKSDPTIDNITAAVCSHFNVPEKVLYAKTRKREIATARQVAMYLAKHLTSLSLNDIGMRMGKRNHATVLHSIKQVCDMMEYDTVLRQSVKQLENMLMS